MTDLETLKLRFLRNKYPGTISKEEALELAIHAEEIKLSLSPGDPTGAYFFEMQRDFETLAFLLEREEIANQRVRLV